MRYNFENIAGYTVEKEELKRLCEIFNNRAKYQKKGAKLPKGIIFYGEAGTGKTLFAKVMASECNLNVLKINVADAEKESDVCKLIKKTFAEASRKKSPTMIFFDELDKVLPNEEEEYQTDRAKTILTQLLTLIDGMDSTGNVVFVATCNYYGSIPETLVRPGRIDKKINIGLPNYASRVDILNMYAKKCSCKFEMTMEELAKLCSGFSCAALETLVNECVLQSDEDGFVSETLIRSRFFEIKNEDIPRERSSVEDFINACCNVGMFVVAKEFNNGHYTLSVEKNDIANTFFDNLITLSDNDCDWDDDDYEDEDDEDSCVEDNENQVNLFSKIDYLNAITVLYGGYVAEEIILHKVYNNVKPLLDSVEYILSTMAECSMFGINLRYSQDRESDILPYTSEHVAKMNAIFEQTVTACYEKAKVIVEKNVGLIEKLAKTLVEKQLIQEKDCEQLLVEFGYIK